MVGPAIGIGRRTTTHQSSRPSVLPPPTLEKAARSLPTMGNNPSTPNHPRATAPGHEPPRQPRRNTNPIAVTNQGVAAPPESSLAHAQGSTASQASSWKSPAEWASSGAASTIPSISSASRTRSDGLPEASKPVDVPVAPGGPSASTSASQSPSATRHRHHHHHHHHHHRGYEDEDEADREDDESLDAPSTSPPLPPSSTATTTNHAPASVGPLSSGSIQDMSYLATRPPRLPLPIEEEIHAPGSPILSPVGGKDILGEPLEEIGSDGRGVTAGQSVVAGARLADEDESDLAGTQSMLSAVTVSDEEDLDELRVDRTRPVVPTRIEWAHGGTKVYVTGTIFLWTRKTRLYPVYVSLSSPSQPLSAPFCLYFFFFLLFSFFLKKNLSHEIFTSTCPYSHLRTRQSLCVANLRQCLARAVLASSLAP